ncbi:MAG: hypothetical protein AAFV62_01390 [Pseudomonadota bacterium]
MKQAGIVVLLTAVAVFGLPWPGPKAENTAAFCDNPAAICRSDLSPSCLQRVGAGSIAADDPQIDCNEQMSRYRACLKRAAACGGEIPASKPTSTSVTCSAFVEETLYEAARNDTSRHAAFEQACPESPLLQLLPRPASTQTRGEVPDATARRLEVVHGRRTQVCAKDPKAATSLTLRIWKRSNFAAAGKATLSSPSLAEDLVLAEGDRIALSDRCQIALVKTGYKGVFFAEIAATLTGADHSQ